MPSTEQLKPFEAAGDLPPEQVPDIDVGALFADDPSGRARVAEGIGRPCREPGFFRIHNTCIAQPLIDSLRSQMRGFFELSDADPIKRAVHNGANAGNGWGPI